MGNKFDKNKANSKSEEKKGEDVPKKEEAKEKKDEEVAKSDELVEKKEEDGPKISEEDKNDTENSAKDKEPHCTKNNIKEDQIEKDINKETGAPKITSENEDIKTNEQTEGNLTIIQHQEVSESKPTNIANETATETNTKSIETVSESHEEKVDIEEHPNVIEQALEKQSEDHPNQENAKTAPVETVHEVPQNLPESEKIKEEIQEKVEV